MDSPKKASGLDLDQKKPFIEDFYIKILNVKRKRSNSNFQGTCEYQTTTNIAFSCKMVRVPFLLSMILKFPTRQYLSGIDSPKKASGLDLDKKNFIEDFYIKSLNWKRKRSNSNFQVTCEYQTTTNIAFSCKMVRVPFLLSMILEIPTRQYLSGIDSPKKASGLDLEKKTFFEDFYIKSLNWKRKRSKSNFQVTCEYQTTTNIAFFGKWYASHFYCL